LTENKSKQAYMKGQLKFLLIIIVSYIISTSMFAQVEINLASTTLTEREVAVGLDVPWEILWGPDDHIWVTERKGIVKRIEPSSGNTSIILDIQEEVFTNLEPGLLGMVLHPNFENEPTVFLIYTFKETGSEMRLVSYHWNGIRLEDEKIVLTLRYGLFGGTNHVGSRLLITEDEKIFLSIGDGGTFSSGQDLNKLYGKILRINLDGTIPDDNPITDSYVYSYGHRNPQGLAFGPMNKLYSSEHGDSHSDEFNLILPGGNYGWPKVEGYCDTEDEILFCSTNNIHEPIHSWTPCQAVNGMEYYNHEAIPEWRGKFLLCFLGGFSGSSPGIAELEVSQNDEELVDQKLFFDSYGRIRDLCINPHNGAIYFATNGYYYAGQGPNRIIEYRNLNYVSTVTNKSNPAQFFDVKPNLLIDNKQCTISCSKEFQNSTVTLYSYNGKLIKSFIINSTHELLDLSYLPKGSYFLKASNKYGSISKTIIIQ